MKIAQGLPYTVPIDTNQTKATQNENHAKNQTITFDADRNLQRTIQQKISQLDAIERDNNQGIVAIAMGQYILGINHLTSVLEISKFSHSIHLIRAEAALAIKEYQLLRYDVVSALNVIGFHEKAILLLSKAYYNILGNVQHAIQNLDYCIRMVDIQRSNDLANGKTVTNKTNECESLRKHMFIIQQHLYKIDDLTKQGAYEDAADECDELIDLEPKGPLVIQLTQKQCILYRKGNDTVNTVNYCTTAIKQLTEEKKQKARAQESESKEMNMQFLELYLARAWAFATLKKYDAATNDLKNVLEYSMNDPRIDEIRELITKKEIKKRNYYEILNVTAGKQKHQ